jgi:hypothetical protein
MTTASTGRNAAPSPDAHRALTPQPTATGEIWWTALACGTVFAALAALFVTPLS